MSDRELLQFIYDLCQAVDYEDTGLAEQTESLIRYYTDIGPSGYDPIALKDAFDRLGRVMGTGENE